MIRIKNKSAFTLVELLVVIAIIGLIATLSVIALSNARAKSRDTKRVTDIKQVQTALELFFNDEGRYPTLDEWNGGSLYSVSTFGTTTYMERIPSAPTNADGDCSSLENTFSYKPSFDGSSYGISFCLGQGAGSYTAGPKCASGSGILDEYCRTSLIAGTGTYTLNSYSMVSGNLIPQASSDFSTNGVSWWLPIRGTLTWNSDTQDATYVVTDNSGEQRLQRGTLLESGKKYRVSFRAKSSNSTLPIGRVFSQLSWMATVSNPPLSTSYQSYEFEIPVIYSSTYYIFIMFFSGQPIGTNVTMDDIVVTEIPPLDTIASSTEYLANTAAGTIAIPSTQAYGTWEFDWYPTVDAAGNGRIYFITDAIDIYPNVNSYMFDVGSSEKNIRIGESSNSPSYAQVMATAANYIYLNTWYRIKIVRTTAGEFSLYIKGGVYSDNYVLVSISGGSGANPVIDNTYTTSNYFVLDLDAGDKIANIVLNGQPVYLSLP